MANRKEKWSNLFMLPLLIILFACQGLSFSAKENPIKKLKFSVRLTEGLQLLYISDLFLNGDNFNQNLNPVIPMTGLFPFPFTTITGETTGRGGETILYDYSECTTSPLCHLFYHISYPGNSYIKERKINILIKSSYPNQVTDDSVIEINENQKLKNGANRAILLITGEDGLLKINDIFPPLSPVENKEEIYYFSKITASSQIYPSSVTFASGYVVYPDDGKIKKICEDNNLQIVVDNNYSLEITQDSNLNFYNIFPEKNEVRYSLRQGSITLNFYFTEKSPVKHIYFSARTTEAISFEEKIINNDSTSDTLTGYLSNGQIMLNYDKFTGILTYFKNWDNLKISGQIKGEDGVFDINISAQLGVMWDVDYWWDSYKSEDIAPDEEGNLKYMLLKDGTGSVTLYDKGGIHSSRSYSLSFEGGVIK